jgi:coproporphyrinogen III oxidase
MNCAASSRLPTARTSLSGTRWQRAGDSHALAGDGVTAVLEDGALFERGGVALSDVRGTNLPPAATARNPQLAGRPFRAMGVSVVMHPRNPQVPTSHMNVRYFSAGDIWWFGGGFDLTPYLPYEEDAANWHRAAAAACAPFHAGLYAHLRATCDEYFYLKHRAEARGVGGIFYDDLNQDKRPDFGMPWERCFEFMRAVGAQYLAAYRNIVQLRRDTAVRRARAPLPALSARPLRGVQSAARSRHAVRPAIRRTHGRDPHVHATDRAMGLSFA